MKDTGAPKSYGYPPPEVPEEMGRVSRLLRIQDSALAWLTAAFAPVSSAVPNQLRLPEIQPVLEVYRPLIKFVDLVTPAPAAQFATLNMADGIMWVVLSLSFKLLTSATVANRAVSVYFGGRDQPGGQIPFCLSGGNFTHLASLGVFYCAAPIGMVGSVLTQSFPGSYDNLVMVPIPPQLTLRGAIKGLTAPHQADQMIISVINLSAGDQLSQGRMVVLESPAMAA